MKKYTSVSMIYDQYLISIHSNNKPNFHALPQSRSVRSTISKVVHGAENTHM